MSQMVSPQLHGNAALDPSVDPFAGTPYVAVARLGAGGMGEVFLVEHREIGRLFVAKVQHPWLSDNPSVTERMRIEAEGLGNLRHANIVTIADYGRLPVGRSYILMEYLKGRTLREELLARGHLPVFEALAYACELLSALAAAHAIGIVHRDIKPSNLFLHMKSARRSVLKVLDFGVARVASESSPVRPLPPELLTRTGQVIGSSPYQSPEGAVGAHVDGRADLYAASLVLYTMLAGRGPFDHVDASMILLAHAQQVPEPPSRFAVQPIPAELDEAILRALAKNPNARFQTAEEFRSVLVSIASRLGRPAEWAQERARSVKSETQDDRSPRPAQVSPARGIAPAPLSPSGSKGRESRGLLAQRSHLLLFLATAFIAAALVIAVLIVLRGG